MLIKLFSIENVYEPNFNFVECFQIVMIQSLLVKKHVKMFSVGDRMAVKRGKCRVGSITERKLVTKWKLIDTIIRSDSENNFTTLVRYQNDSEARFTNRNRDLKRSLFACKQFLGSQTLQHRIVTGDKY